LKKSRLYSKLYSLPPFLGLDYIIIAINRMAELKFPSTAMIALG
jgi:hypothetical protein